MTIAELPEKTRFKFLGIEFIRGGGCDVNGQYGWYWCTPPSGRGISFPLNGTYRIDPM